MWYQNQNARNSSYNQEKSLRRGRLKKVCFDPKNKKKNNVEVEVNEQTSEEKSSGVFSTAEFDKLFSAATDDAMAATEEFSALNASLTNAHNDQATSINVPGSDAGRCEKNDSR